MEDLKSGSPSCVRVNKRPHSKLKAKGVEFGFFVDVVFAGVAELGKLARLLGEGPNEAFSGRNGFGFTAKDFVFEGERSVNPLPAGFFEGSHDITEDEGVEDSVVQEDGMADIEAKNVYGELAVVRGAIQKMSDEAIAIGSKRGFRLLD